DIKNVVDVQGLTITKGKDTGTILLDASGNENNKSNKAQDVKVAGHEAGEIKYLQNGNGLIFKDSYDTKEAMNDSSGNSFYNRLNEAANGNLTDVTYDSKSNDYVNAGTSFSNNVEVRTNGVEYRQLLNKEITALSNKKNINDFMNFYHNKFDVKINYDVAKRSLAQGGASLVDNKYNDKFGSDKNGKEYNAVVDFAKVFIKDNLTDNSKAEFYDDKTKSTNLFNASVNEKKDFEGNYVSYPDNKDFYEENLKSNNQDTSSTKDYAKGVINDTKNVIKAIYDTNGKIIAEGIYDLLTSPVDTLTSQGKDLRKKYDLSQLYENAGEYAKAKELKGSVITELVGYVAGTAGVGKTVLTKGKVNIARDSIVKDGSKITKTKKESREQYKNATDKSLRQQYRQKNIEQNAHNKSEYAKAKQTYFKDKDGNLIWPNNKDNVDQIAGTSEFYVIKKGDEIIRYVKDKDIERHHGGTYDPLNDPGTYTTTPGTNWKDVSLPGSESDYKKIKLEALEDILTTRSKVEKWFPNGKGAGIQDNHPESIGSLANPKTNGGVKIKLKKESK
ncbi:MAG: hypothetical protein HRT42_12790, partial [Campylobacteraceae bacterium]|nr:hypothetical protein [Campylobacteraceae bacterium]